MVALSFKLPAIGKGGWWRVRVSVRGQIEEKFIRMTKMRTQQWEVGTPGRKMCYVYLLRLL